MYLTMKRHRPGMAMRLWTDADGPLPVPAEGLAVEWAGRLGHPSSYALLGGALTPQPVPDLDRGRFDRSLAGGLDTVTSGLPAEYREAVRSATEDRLHITTAAHGEIGSSPVAFFRVATILLRLLETSVPVSEEALWQLWDESGETLRLD